eukprot:TRINITY_DN8563_c0_g1_i5.p1 TRINITY_DN8563_c0_g1~~TRINITY_DN8563_c0_g1_i5.p1  ORF type:complete len:177 (+),score=40.42 TRINITY_DN8563_c0_g1_i5:110-640(+)
MKILTERGYAEAVVSTQSTGGDDDGQEHLPFPSAGAMYCVQTYLISRHIEGLPSGSYIFSPTYSQLVQLPSPSLNFSEHEVPQLYIFLVADLLAMNKLYKAEYCLPFCTTEAGHMVSVMHSVLQVFLPDLTLEPCRDVDVLPLGPQPISSELFESFKISADSHEVIFVGRIKDREL